MGVKSIAYLNSPYNASHNFHSDYTLKKIEKKLDIPEFMPYKGKNSKKWKKFAILFGEDE